MQGLHLTADLHRCQCALPLLLDAKRLADALREHTQAVGLRIVGEHWHTFPEREQPGGGVTGVLLLAESHVAVHTWPELRGVTLDVYVCNVGADNSGKARALMNGLHTLFQPHEATHHALMRGEVAGLLTQD